LAASVRFWLALAPPLAAPAAVLDVLEVVGVELVVALVAVVAALVGVGDEELVVLEELPQPASARAPTARTAAESLSMREL